VFKHKNAHRMREARAYTQCHVHAPRARKSVVNGPSHLKKSTRLIFLLSDSGERIVLGRKTFAIEPA
jgi:hypothetical protein